MESTRKGKLFGCLGIPMREYQFWVCVRATTRAHTQICQLAIWISSGRRCAARQCAEPPGCSGHRSCGPLGMGHTQRPNFLVG